MKKWIPLLLIVLLGSILRIYKIDRNPAGFFCDEASIGYNAYTLTTRGEDDTGKKFPLFFKSFGEYKNPIEIYTTIPFIYFFGLNELSTRLTSAIFGILSIITLYLLVASMLDYNVAIISSAFLAFSPWHIHLSRISLEGLTPFIFFVLMGTLFFVKSREKPIFLLFSAFFFGFSLYTYFAARIFTPLFVLGIVLLLIKDLRKIKTQVLLSVLIFTITVVPLLLHTISGSGLARWNQVSIFSNKPINTTVTQVFKNYFAYFSYDFLFTKGDAEYKGQRIKRHSILGMGELYLFQLPLIAMGMFFLLKRRGNNSKMIILWLLLYPLPGAITKDLTPYATRGFAGVIPFQIIAAVGLEVLFNYARTVKKIIYYGLVVTITIVLFFSFLNFWLLLKQYPYKSSNFWGWQFGPRDIMKTFLENKDKYDDLIIVGNFNAPDIFLKFYDPKGSCLDKCKIGGVQKTFDSRRKQLFAIEFDKISEMPSDLTFKQRSIVYYPNGSPAFYVGEFQTLE